jgi:hypothetical protein
MTYWHSASLAQQTLAGGTAGSRIWPMRQCSSPSSPPESGPPTARASIYSSLRRYLARRASMMCVIHRFVGAH